MHKIIFWNKIQYFLNFVSPSDFKEDDNFLVEKINNAKLASAKIIANDMLEKFIIIP
ncbi:hypothetical protein ONA23_03585 [Mycoplasmopsis cynos]|uniref:hypothetical protein n=1 Tax=Mycoplasmopsis cynos TaxID=171284 RepID=UPI0024C64E70|nr:hypothetical protein [Mycoplasmopsis cynos]WAM07171.1 hypothetical protein ONA23_03585 [Mycoplasmopsis cynos]